MMSLISLMLKRARDWPSTRSCVPSITLTRLKVYWTVSFISSYVDYLAEQRIADGSFSASRLVWTLPPWSRHHTFAALQGEARTSAQRGRSLLPRNQCNGQHPLANLMITGIHEPFSEVFGVFEGTNCACTINVHALDAQVWRMCCHILYLFWKYLFEPNANNNIYSEGLHADGYSQEKAIPQFVYTVSGSVTFHAKFWICLMWFKRLRSYF